MKEMVETEMSCGDTGELAASTSSCCWILKSVLLLVLIVLFLYQRSPCRALPLTSRKECGERDGVRGHNVKKVKRWTDKIRSLSLKSGIVLSPGSPIHSPIHQIFLTAFQRVQVFHVSICEIVDQRIFIENRRRVAAVDLVVVVVMRINQAAKAWGWKNHTPEAEQMSESSVSLVPKIFTQKASQGRLAGTLRPYVRRCLVNFKLCQTNNSWCWENGRVRISRWWIQVQVWKAILPQIWGI